MFKRIEARQLNDLLLPLSQRPATGVFFVRLCTYSETLKENIWALHQAAAQNGVVIEEHIVNPDGTQISYMTETLGPDFQPDADFILKKLAIWMPRMSDTCRKEFTDALCTIFNEQKRMGKPDGVLKNIYVKMMCWLYYRFARIMPQLGTDHIPVVFYECHQISNHELMFLRILSLMGTDIFLMETKGDDAYKKLDASSEYSQLMLETTGEKFPESFSIKAFRKEMNQRPPVSRQPAPQRVAPTSPPVSPIQQPGISSQNQTVAPGSPSNPSVQRHGIQGLNRTSPVSGTRPASNTQASAVPAQSSVPTSQPDPVPSSSAPRMRVQYTRPNYSNPVPEPEPVQASAPSQPQVRHIQTGRSDYAKNAMHNGGSGGYSSSMDSLNSHLQQPKKSPCINAWMDEPTYNEILKPIIDRGQDPTLFYSALIRLSGVPDKTTFVNELFLFNQNFQKTGRNLYIQEGELRSPSPEEIRAIRRRNYNTVEEMIVDLALNIPAGAQLELQRYVQNGFKKAMLDAAKTEPNINKLTVTGVYLLVWILRFYPKLFSGWKDPDVPCFVFLGGSHSQKEDLFLTMLAETPVDILILAPDKNKPCQFEHPSLLDLRFDDTLMLEKFPKENTNLHIRTVASHAERDLDGMIYGDGLYRDKQFSKANSLILQTTFDEIFILWNQELRFRPSFSSDERQVNMPIIFAKVSGVENGKMLEYWQKIKLLRTEDTFFSNQFPLLAPGIGNKYQQLAQKAIRNGKLNRELVKNDRQYPFGLLRDELQEHLLDKIQLMLDNKIIKGTFQNGTEYTVLATIFNMQKPLLRKIQAFDFTKKNPKLVCISTKDSMASLEDAIMLTFLNLIGFDIVLFIPTGYSTIERYLNEYVPVEHQIGDYIYDQEIPDFDTLPAPKNHAWLNNIIRRR